MTKEDKIAEILNKYFSGEGLQEQLIAQVAQEICQLDDWMPIESAPRDGTEILLYHPKWDNYPIAAWCEHPWNPVEDDDGTRFRIHGWLLGEHYCAPGCVEEGFLGWPDDIEAGCIPTHWKHIIPPKEVGATDIDVDTKTT